MQQNAAHCANIVAQGQTHVAQYANITAKHANTRCPCDRHVGGIIRHWGDRIRGVAGNALHLAVSWVGELAFGYFAGFFFRVHFIVP